MCACIVRVSVQVFDHNGDGYISKLELHKTMNDLGIELSRRDLDAMMDEADVNKDGRIDYAGTYRHLLVAFSLLPVISLRLSHVIIYIFRPAGDPV